MNQNESCEKNHMEMARSQGSKWKRESERERKTDRVSEREKDGNESKPRRPFVDHQSRMRRLDK